MYRISFTVTVYPFRAMERLSLTAGGRRQAMHLPPIAAQQLSAFDGGRFTRFEKFKSAFSPIFYQRVDVLGASVQLRFPIDL
jgi:hypothetical protein